MSLRISGGYLQGRVLEAPSGNFYRPLTGRLKRSLFDYLGAALQGASVLDLFAGVGSFGVEALSRGAARVTFVEKERAAVECLEANLRALGLEEAARVYAEDVFSYFDVTRPSKPYDIVFLDPPYGQGLAFRAVERLATWPGFGAGTVGLVKTFKKERFAGPEALALLEVRRVGDDNLSVFRRASSGGDIKAPAEGDSASPWAETKDE
ncbi:MAG: 16S rRNA (guanine(966)-N(2))-methyltransferase RsmD [Candidatus Coatesbacteria bacterium]|nr:MAG: 16S rRNA (guanine(966)-N(2))-methyltransferase RsmD [Candidatus Coatesbacteria bacterium]